MSGNVFQRVFKLLNLTDLFRKSTRGRLPENSILEIDDHEGNPIITVKEATKWINTPVMGNIVVKQEFTGGGEDALDSIDGSNLQTGVSALVVKNKTFYIMEYVKGATDGENPPHVVVPDTNANGRWFLRSVSFDKLQENQPFKQNLIVNSEFLVNYSSELVGFEDPNVAEEGISNLVTNGTFDNDLSGWTLQEGSGGGAITWDNGRIKFTQGGTSTPMHAYQKITVEGRRLYRVRWNLVSGGSGCKILIGIDEPSPDTAYTSRQPHFTYEKILDISIDQTGQGEAYFWVYPDPNGSLTPELYLIIEDQQGAGAESIWDDIDVSMVVVKGHPAGAGHNAGDVYVIPDSETGGYFVKVVKGSGGWFTFPFWHSGHNCWYQLHTNFINQNLVFGLDVHVVEGNLALSGVLPGIGLSPTSSWQWVETTGKNQNQIQWEMHFNWSDPVKFKFRHPMLTYGTYIGEGNYVPGHGLVWLESELFSQFQGSGYSDFGDMIILPIDTKGAILGAKSVIMHAKVSDSQSSQYDCYLRLSGYRDILISPYGRANNAIERQTIRQMVMRDVKVSIGVNATGVDTFNINKLQYLAVEV